jgi:hypothetical protein
MAKVKRTTVVLIFQSLPSRRGALKESLGHAFDKALSIGE